MHGSKGLTKKTVVLPGLEDAWLPGSNDDNFAEKQRLFYVAITRATDEVLITVPRSRARGDPLHYDAPGRNEVSRFVTDSEITVQYF
jgi:superfamily I DNA/RNA helicase